jgi:O-antigen/teichoic acid export membrane protein
MKSVGVQFFKNILTSYAGMVVSMGITFFFTPFFIGQLGKDLYGVWTLTFSILAFFELADAGMRQSMVRFISKYYATNDWNNVNKVFSSSAIIYFVIGSIFALATIIFSFWFLDSFKIPGEYLEPARYTFLIIGLSQAVNFARLPFTSLGPFHRFDIGLYFTLGIKIVQTTGIVILLLLDLGLVEMAVLVFVVHQLARTWQNAVRKRMFPQMSFAREYIDSGTMKEMLSYGLYAFLIVATYLLINSSDNVILGRFLSTEAVAIFAVPMAIIMQLRSSIYMMCTPLVPAISHLEAEKDIAKIVDIYSRATRYVYFLSAYFCIMVLTFGGPFLLLWVKHDFADSIEVLYILIIPAAIHMPQTIANSILYGISKHQVTLYILGAEAISKIVLSLILLGPLGIIGVALGTAIPQIIIYSAIFPWVFYRTLKAPVSSFYSTAGMSIAKAIVIVLPVALAMKWLLPPESWAAIITDGAVATVPMIFGLFSFVLLPGDKRRFVDGLKSLVGKKA